MIASATPRILSPVFVLVLLLAGALRAQEAGPGPTPLPTDVLVLRGGHVIDGTGSPAYRADVAVSNGRIVALGSDLAGDRVVDVSGHVVAPGFIDTHAHVDADVVRRPLVDNFLQMGVTTLITGNCGSSVTDLAAHFRRLERGGLGPNYGSLVGHGTVRGAVMKNARRAPTDDELAAMRARVREAMEAGAFGLSTGLIYVPGTYAETDELIALSREVAAFGGVYASHMRDEADDVLTAIDEARRIGREAGVRVHLSHLKASGRANWGLSEAIVESLQQARLAGERVTGDQYAYTASSTSLDVLFPSAELEIGRGAFGQRLAEDRAFRVKMAAAALANARAAGFDDLSYARIARAPGHEELDGVTLDVAAERLLGKKSPEDQALAATQLFIDAEGRRIGMVYHKMSEADVETVMRAPFVGVACDAGTRTPGVGKPHPRGSGNNPRVLGHYVRERGVLPLEAAVAKMTSLPARVFGLEGRGVVCVGAVADLVVFDPRTVADTATYAEPFGTPVGLPHVLVRGVFAVRDGEVTGARAGEVLRHRGATGAR